MIGRAHHHLALEMQNPKSAMDAADRSRLFDGGILRTKDDTERPKETKTPRRPTAIPPRPNPFFLDPTSPPYGRRGDQVALSLYKNAVFEGREPESPGRLKGPGGVFRGVHMTASCDPRSPRPPRHTPYSTLVILLYGAGDVKGILTGGSGEIFFGEGPWRLLKLG